MKIQSTFEATELSLKCKGYVKVELSSALNHDTASGWETKIIISYSTVAGSLWVYHKVLLFTTLENLLPFDLLLIAEVRIV